MLLFHTTPRENLRGILTSGLVASDQKPVHLAESRGQFEDLVEFCHDTDDLITFAVMAEGLTLDRGWDGPESRTCRSTIPVARLALVSH